MFFQICRNFRGNFWTKNNEPKEDEMANIFFVLGTIVFFLFALFLLKAILSNPIGKELFLSCDRLPHPNAISLYGLSAAIFGLVLFDGGFMRCAFVAYDLASFLDGADGSMARALGKSSDTGKWLDPLCDKFRHFSFLAFFLHLGIVELVPLLAFFLADLASQFSRVFISKAKREAGASIGSNIFGKGKTVAADLLVAYCFMINLEPWLPNFTSIGLFFILALSILSTVFKFFPLENLRSGKTAKSANCV